VYNQVTIDLVTQYPPGITALDFDLAHKAQTLAERRS
jgi:pterin-4a-carbinolamine dehydratase